MSQRFRTVAMLLAVLGLGIQVSAGAAETKKHTGTHKTHAKAASATHSKVAAKPVAKRSEKTAAKPAGKHRAVAAAPAAKARHVATAAPKAVRHVTMIEDPRHLALLSASALVVDQSSGQAVIEKQADTVVPIASISKLMTAMVVLDAKPDMQEVISISDADVDVLKGSRSRLPVGATMTRETAMLLALMSSENRAANALARHYPGGMPAFVQAMNRKAQALGMASSRFEEPTGLSSNNVSTAHDLARMVAAAARYPDIRRFSTTAEATAELKGRVQSFHNTNALVRSDTWEIGVSKTGYISEAGRCLVMQARVADKPVVIVLLDSNGKMTRVGDAQRIKRWMESASLAQERRAA